MQDDEELGLSEVGKLDIHTDEFQAKAAMFREMWEWVDELVYRNNVLKGWTQDKKTVGEHIALIHSEVSEALEAFRWNNPVSKKIPKLTQVEEELADVIIRLMDLAHTKKLGIPRALFLKMEYNSTRPYKHGGKEF